MQSLDSYGGHCSQKQFGFKYLLGSWENGFIQGSQYVGTQHLDIICFSQVASTLCLAMTGPTKLTFL